MHLCVRARQNAKSCRIEYIKVIDVLAQRWTIMCLIMLTVNCQAICETCHQSDVCASVPSDTYSCALQAAANNISRRVLQPPTLPTRVDTVRTSARSVSRCKSPLCDCFLFSALQTHNSGSKRSESCHQSRRRNCVLIAPLPAFHSVMGYV